MLFPLHTYTHTFPEGKLQTVPISQNKSESSSQPEGLLLQNPVIWHSLCIFHQLSQWCPNAVQSFFLRSSIQSSLSPGISCHLSLVSFNVEASPAFLGFSWQWHFWRVFPRLLNHGDTHSTYLMCGITLYAMQILCNLLSVQHLFLWFGQVETRPLLPEMELSSGAEVLTARTTAVTHSPVGAFSCFPLVVNALSLHTFWHRFSPVNIGFIYSI